VHRPLPETTIGAWADDGPARISARARRQRELSARTHAAGNEHARRHGWAVTETTGPFGFGTHSYRDRFDNRRQQLVPGAGPSRISRGAAATLAYLPGAGQADPGLPEDQLLCWNEAGDREHLRAAGE
jgi:hypothetical protein